MSDAPEMAAKVAQTVGSVIAKATPQFVDIFNQFGVIKPEHDDRVESEMSPADMFFLTMSLFLVGGCVSIVGGYYLARSFRGESKDKKSKKE